RGFAGARRGWRDLTIIGSQDYLRQPHTVLWTVAASSGDDASRSRVTPNPASVQATLDQLVDRGPEVGLQVGAYLDGELVVDGCAGLAEEGTNRAVDGETLFNVSSTGKGVAATCLHVLVDRGMVDYAAPVATYWPEFAARGKSCVTVAHVLSHQSGIPQTP